MVGLSVYVPVAPGFDVSGRLSRGPRPPPPAWREPPAPRGSPPRGLCSFGILLGPSAQACHLFLEPKARPLPRAPESHPAIFLRRPEDLSTATILRRGVAWVAPPALAELVLKRSAPPGPEQLPARAPAGRKQPPAPALAGPKQPPAWVLVGREQPPVRALAEAEQPPAPAGQEQ